METENAFDRVLLSAFVMCLYMASLLCVGHLSVCIHNAGKNTSADQSDFFKLQKKNGLGLVLQSKSSRKLKRRLPCNYVTLFSSPQLRTKSFYNMFFIYQAGTHIPFVF